MIQQPDFDVARAKALSSKLWDTQGIPLLSRYVKIPNRSPNFDKKGVTRHHTDSAARLFIDWAEQRPVPLKVERLQLPDRTPIILIDIAATPGCEHIKDTVFYGHADKQPPLKGWLPGLGPRRPVIRNGRLYGRGASDDGYAMPCALFVVQLLVDQDQPHGPLHVLIEFSEESGSPDLDAYIEEYKTRLGNPGLVFCLDSGCGNYLQGWITKSLRGLLAGTLRVRMLTEGQHSGGSSGYVPEVFRTVTKLLARIWDENDMVGVPELQPDIPPQRVAEATAMANTLGDELLKFPWVDGAGPQPGVPLSELVLRNTWGSTLTVIGQEGLPSLEDAGSVLLPEMAFALSFRLPPNLSADVAAEAIKRVLEENPPFGAEVTFEVDKMANGWNSPLLPAWLEDAFNEASMATTGLPALSFGEGGTIPLMGKLEDLFAGVLLLVTGTLGPESNAHGPNEFLDIAYVKNLTVMIAMTLVAYTAQ